MEFFTFDSAYCERLRRDDAPTVEHFVRYFGELIHLKLRSRLNSREAIEDVRQETFTRVLASLRLENGLRQADRLGAFVNSVCNHVLQEHYRSNKRSESGLDDVPEVTFVDHAPGPLRQLETKDTARVVQEILLALPERDRSLLRAVLLEERDKDEICAELGVNREYLRVLVHRAKQQFKVFYVNQFAKEKQN
ncbi:MAG: sigma-70 family RNA polymerase sigma factor [Acidobacteriota bacterium]|nr:sigma-70 family RNA polymerase sigma factor [Acidobacteriota bacterium]